MHQAAFGLCHAAYCIDEQLQSGRRPMDGSYLVGRGCPVLVLHPCDEAIQLRIEYILRC